ncbi:MAG: DciA family protein [Gallionellaceae bacterium]|nr:DciA family protein [Gallionellaceae bacterium]
MPDRLNTFFSASRELSLLSKKANQIIALQKIWEQAIPPSLRRGCHVAYLNQKTLTIEANNGAIAAKLRQMTPELVVQLHEMGVEVTSIQVLVQVSAPHLPHEEPARTLSILEKSLITDFADQLTESPLKEALNRLAHRD